MYTCEERHDKVIYESLQCPLCDLIDKHDACLSELESRDMAIAQLAKDAQKWEKESLNYVVKDTVRV